jgi:putative RNA 2'-phosphotransferase
MTAELTRLSKTMAYALRHKPEEFSLSMDKAGWVSVEELAKALTSVLKEKVTAELIEAVALQDQKQRYTLQGEKIRAAQGHSFPVELGHPVLVPPAVLFHGTATRFLPSIMAEGLKPGSRQFVHLSSQHETAVNVGSRHGKVVVLEVNAAEAHASGVEFRLSENNVWLVSHMPPAFLKPLW